MTRPRYLALFLQAPWKLNGGALIRNYWIALALARRYAVDLVIAEDPQRPAPAEFASRFESIACFATSSGATRLRRLGALLNPRSSYFTGGQVPGAEAEYVRARVRDGAYRAVHVGDLNQVEALTDRLASPVWYDAHNCEAKLVERQVEYERGLVKLFVRADARRVRGVEARLVRRAVHVSACSEQDVIDLTEIEPTAASKCTIVPNGVDVAGLAPVRDCAPKRGCVMIGGSLDWRPTQQGMWWFVNDVVPLLPRSVDGVDLEIRLAGRMGPRLIEALSAHPRLVVSPNPPEIAPELARADVVAVPVLASSGSRLRILEAWAAGRPVVTTPAGAMGLIYENGRELFEHEDAQAFADSIVRLVGDRALWSEMREGGLRRARDYDWPQIGERLLAAHDAVFGDG